MSILPRVRNREQAKVVQRPQQSQILLGLLAQLIEPHGIDALENVAVYPMFRASAVCFTKAQHVLEACDESLLPRCVTALPSFVQTLTRLPPTGPLISQVQGRRGIMPP
jgi:hypothetical protein